MNRVDGIFSKGGYENYVKAKMPKSKCLVGVLKAFLAGGGICVFGQAMRDMARCVFHLDSDGIGAFSSIVLIALGAFLTSAGVYDVLGRFAGAGFIVPITGFGNSVVAPAMEYKSEGFILGVGAKMFTVAGPVIVYGITASIAAGIFYFIAG